MMLTEPLHSVKICSVHIKTLSLYVWIHRMYSVKIELYVYVYILFAVIQITSQLLLVKQ